MSSISWSYLMVLFLCFFFLFSVGMYFSLMTSVWCFAEVVPIIYYFATIDYFFTSNLYYLQNSFEFGGVGVE